MSRYGGRVKPREQQLSTSCISHQKNLAVPSSTRYSVSIVRRISLESLHLGLADLGVYERRRERLLRLEEVHSDAQGKLIRVDVGHGVPYFASFMIDPSCPVPAFVQ